MCLNCGTWALVAAGEPQCYPSMLSGTDTRTHVGVCLLQDMVRQEMERTYGRDKIAAVNVVTDTRKLDPLLAKYDATKQKLDDLTSNYSKCDLASAASTGVVSGSSIGSSDCKIVSPRLQQWAKEPLCD